MDKSKKGQSESFARWQKEFEGSSPDKNKKFMTVSSKPIKPLYTPDDISKNDFDRDIGYPGQYPYTEECMPRCIAGKCGQCGSFPDSERPGKPTNAIIFC